MTVQYSRAECYSKKAADEKKQCNKFCPIINENCRTDCICFKPAHFTEVHNDREKYTYFSCYCIHPAVMGVVEVEIT